MLDGKLSGTQYSEGATVEMPTARGLIWVHRNVNQGCSPSCPCAGSKCDVVVEPAIESRPVAGSVPIRVYDVAGRLVRIITDGRAWDQRDEGGKPVPAGIYFVKTSGETKRTTRKIVVIR
jgi:hypothetical protein